MEHQATELVEVSVPFGEWASPANKAHAGMSVKQADGSWGSWPDQIGADGTVVVQRRVLRRRVESGSTQADVADTGDWVKRLG